MTVQVLTAYVPASGNRPNPKADAQLSVGRAVDGFAATSSTCQDTEIIILIWPPIATMLRVTLKGH